MRGFFCVQVIVTPGGTGLADELPFGVVYQIAHIEVGNGLNVGEYFRQRAQGLISPLSETPVICGKWLAVTMSVTHPIEPWYIQCKQYVIDEVLGATRSDEVPESGRLLKEDSGVLLLPP